MSLDGKLNDWPVVAGVLLVDAQGRILLQHRDANAPTSPNKWAQPGGHVEQGEAPEEAAARELLEETGIGSDVPLRLFKFFYLVLDGSDGASPEVVPADVPGPEARIIREVSIFYGSTTARQEDLVMGEGDALVFLPPDEALQLDMAWSTEYVLPLFVRSPEYLSLSSEAVR